ncbi:MAG: sphingomyelin phosphodiesterase [Amphiamblys sp. WSBS2006]|nr:MAG: sphingomyelin phosphodiesterase [Amphiamblys sp. WSBS2006]
MKPPDMKLFLFLAAEILATAGRDSSGSSLSFLFVTDIHLDKKYRPGGAPSTFCREGVSGEKKAGFFGEPGCDIPPYTFEHAVEQMKGRVSSPDFVIIGGDTGAHDREQTLSSYFAAYLSSIRELKRSYPSVAVLPVLGNNDFPGMDFKDGPNGILDGYWEMWKDAIPGSQESAFKKCGVYSVEEKGVKMLILNTNYFSLSNAHDCRDESSACCRQLSWLEGELGKHAARKENVLVIGHHPPTAEYFHRAALSRLLGILKKHKGSIHGVLAGHIHKDTFFLYNSDGVHPGGEGGVEAADGFVAAAPSIVKNSQVRFRKYKYRGKAGLVDYTQYIVFMERRKGREVVTSKKEYSFREEYGTDGVSTAAFVRLNNQILSGSSSKRRFTQHVQAEL